MPTSSHIFPAAFITPAAHELPPYIRALTTTKVLPDATNETVDTAANNTGWPPTPHIKGAELESAFAQRGHGLHHYLPSAPLWLQQVHGVDVASVDGDTDAARQTPPVADAAVTRTPNTVLAILTADCLPVVIAAEDRLALAVVHAGWRSLSGGVLENTLRSMECPAASLTVWLGPAIGPTAFEVGEDVYAAFNAAHDHETASCFIPTGASGKWHADLYALARFRLRRLGVSKISGGTWCTYNDAERFFSYRRQRDEGRMATFAWIEKQGSGIGYQKVASFCAERSVSSCAKPQDAESKRHMDSATTRGMTAVLDSASCYFMHNDNGAGFRPYNSFFRIPAFA